MASVSEAVEAEAVEAMEDEFDEEAVERDDFEIEKLIEGFVNEPSIRHDEVPESESDSDIECNEGEKLSKLRSSNCVRRGNRILYKDQRFINGVAFKECVLDYALRTGRNIKQYRYDKDKIGFKCVGGASVGEPCEWKVYASILSKDNIWKIRVLVDKHSCVPNGSCEMLKVPHIARLFVDNIREEPEFYMPMKIEEIIQEKWEITVSRPQCQVARLKALKWIECEYDHQFARLRDYAAELIESNPDSTVVIDTLTYDKGEEEFNRFYVCFNKIKQTWKETCRPLIGMDGCFLKHKVKGQFLVALGRDADNAIYPIAWGVVQVENNENWLWFVSKVRDDLGLKDGTDFILVSDRQKGLIHGVRLALPKIEHRMCVRHIYANLKKKHGSKSDMKPYIWSLAWSYNEAQFQQRLDRIFNYDSEVYDDVQKMKPRTWCRAFYKIGNCCEEVENNSTESFNSTITKAREKAFVPMLETVRRLAMVRIAKRSAISHDHKGICTPYVTDFLAAEHKKAKDCKVTRSTNGMYEVRLGSSTYRVSLENRSCTCRKFEICGIPCEHAYGVMLQKKLAPENFVSHWFRTATWRLNYTEGLVPVRGASFWPSTSAPDIHIPSDPKQPGRKKITKADKKRKKGVNESPKKKQPKHKKRTMHCGICGMADHNSRFHTKKQASPAVSQAASQTASPTTSQCHEILGYGDMC